MGHLFFWYSSLGHHRQGREGRFWKEGIRETPYLKNFTIPVLSLLSELSCIAGKVVCACVLFPTPSHRTWCGHIQWVGGLAEVPGVLVLEEWCVCAPVCVGTCVHTRPAGSLAAAAFGALTGPVITGNY